MSKRGRPSRESQFAKAGHAALVQEARAAGLMLDTDEHSLAQSALPALPVPIADALPILPSITSSLHTLRRLLSTLVAVPISISVGLSNMVSQLWLNTRWMFASQQMKSQQADIHRRTVTRHERRLVASAHVDMVNSTLQLQDLVAKVV